MTDVLDVLARKHAVQLSAEIQEQLTAKKGHSPLLVILSRARQDATTAIAALCEVDPESIDKVRICQNEVRRFIDLVQWMGEMIEAGNQPDITEDEQSELITLISQGSPELIREYQRLGIPLPELQDDA